MPQSLIQTQQNCLEILNRVVFGFSVWTILSSVSLLLFSTFFINEKETVKKIFVKGFAFLLIILNLFSNYIFFVKNYLKIFSVSLLIIGILFLFIIFFERGMLQITQIIKHRELEDKFQKILQKVFRTFTSIFNASIFFLLIFVMRIGIELKNEELAFDPSNFVFISITCYTFLYGQISNQRSFEENSASVRTQSIIDDLKRKISNRLSDQRHIARINSNFDVFSDFKIIKKISILDVFDVIKFSLRLKTKNDKEFYDSSQQIKHFLCFIHNEQVNSSSKNIGNLISTNIDFYDIDIKKTHYSVAGCNFSGCYFNKCCLSGMLKNKNVATCFDDVELDECDFSNAIFGEGSSFIGANLQETNFKNAEFYSCLFGKENAKKRTNANYCSFKGALFGKQTSVTNCDFVCANFKNATFEYIEFSNCNFAGADFLIISGSNFKFFKNNFYTTKTYKIFENGIEREIPPTRFPNDFDPEKYSGLIEIEWQGNSKNEENSGWKQILKKND